MIRADSVDTQDDQEDDHYDDDDHEDDGYDDDCDGKIRGRAKRGRRI